MTADVRDSPYSWVVAVAACFMYFIMYGMSRTTGWLFVGTLNHFNTDRETASFPFTLGCALTYLVGPLAGYLARRIGIRLVILFGCILSSAGICFCSLAEDVITVTVLWGGLYGVGAGLASTLLPQVNNLYFDKHLVKATGISYAGASISGFVLPPITQALLQEYGIAGVYLLLGGITLHSIPAAILLRSPSQQEKSSQKTQISTIKCSDEESKDTKNHITPRRDFLNELHERFDHKLQKTIDVPNDFSVLWNPLFLVISLTSSLNALFCFVLPAILVDYSEDKGIGLTNSTYLLMALSIADTVGRLAFGWVTDSGYLSRKTFSVLCFFVAAVSFVFLVWSTGFITLTISLSVIGVCVGTLAPLHPALISEYIEPNKQTMANASFDILSVPFILSTSSLIGYFRDDLGSYDWLIYIQSLMAFGASSILLLLPCIASCKQKSFFPKDEKKINTEHFFYNCTL